MSLNAKSLMEFLEIVDKELKEGEEINLSVDVPGDNVPIFACGEVAWQRAAGEGDLLRRRAAVLRR